MFTADCRRRSLGVFANRPLGRAFLGIGRGGRGVRYVGADV